MTAAVAALAALLVACGGGASGKTEFEPDPLTQTVPASPIAADTPPEPGVLRVVGQPSLTYDLVRAGAGHGFYSQEGLAVRFLEARSGAAAGGALRAGTADGAIVSADEALVLAADGQRLRIVLLLTSLTAAEQLVARAGVDDVAGLAGARIAFAPGGDGELLVRGALASADVPAAGVVLLPAADPGGLLLDGAADAAAVDAARAAELAVADPALQPIATAGDQPGLLSRVLVVRDDVAAGRPGQVLAFVRAWQDLYLYERDDPEVAAADLALRTRQPVAAAAAALAGIGLYDVPANAVELLPGGEFYDRTARAIGAASTASGRLGHPVDEVTLLDGAFAQTVATGG